MITKNKLANQPENKLTKKFHPIDMDDDFNEKTKRSHNGHKKRTRKRKFVLLLPILMILVASATFGMIWLANKGGRADDKISDNSETREDPNAESIDSEEDKNTDKDPEDTAIDNDIGEEAASVQPISGVASNNPTIKYGRLMLINPNFMVEPEFIAARKLELVSMEGAYGIHELHPYNGDNLLDKEAGEFLNKMLADYTVANPGHVMQTVSCFREVGTSCGRLCAATGASDHHTGLTCDLIDPTYGTSLDSSQYEQHLEWQWLKNNSYKYGFIDRFPEAWAGGSMDEPLNVNAEGSTGLYETWHYRYVGIYAATQIATGVYNNGQYDSLEHYLKARGLVLDLLNGH